MDVREWFGLRNRFSEIGLPETATAAEVAKRIEAMRIDAQRAFLAGDGKATRTLALIEAANAALRDDDACRRHLQRIAAGRRRLRAALAYFAFPAVIVGASAAWVSSLPPPRPEAAPPDFDADAYRVCAQFVANRLKAPSTAVFQPYRPGLARQTLSVAAQRWEATGYVDAQNGFSAQIRSNWTCAVDSDGGQWRLVEIDIKPR